MTTERTTERVDEPTDEKPPAPGQEVSDADEHDERGDEQDADESPRDKRYRQQLRQVERERDTLREALVPHLGAEVEKVAGQKLTSGRSIWLIPGLDPLQLVDDKLSVDAAKVKAVVAKLVEHAPQLAQVVPSFDGGARSTGSTGTSWRDVIGGRPS